MKKISLFVVFLTLFSFFAFTPIQAIAGSKKAGDPCTAPNPDSNTQTECTAKTGLVCAQDPGSNTGFSCQPQININPPTGQGISPSTPLSTLLTNVIALFFVVGALLVMYFLVMGAFDWILSGGDKEKISSARSKIINALIGFAILAVAFVLLRLVGSLIHIDINNLNLPALGPASGITPTP